jgi:NAD(P)-dependent dehydrogenase (short-subunit alcohol dehydrogenase family)
VPEGADRTARRPRLDGRVALVTGAGRGLGRAHALELARCGASVVVNDVGAAVDGTGGDATVVDEVVAAVRTAGGSAVADSSDIGSFAGAERAVAAAISAYGRIDVLVNNAGIMRSGGLAEMTEADLHRMLAVHVVGTIGTMRAAFPHMAAAAFGRIVNTTSETAITPGPGAIAYATAKAAVLGATRAMAAEGSEHGITANALSPGALTRMSAEEIARRAGGQQPDLDASHVARVVAALVAPEASAVTGRVFHAAGGAVREYVTERLRETPGLDIVRALLDA